MKLLVHPWPVVLIYISGMIFTTSGIVSLIISIDPMPFDRSSWLSFLYIGICFLLAGAILLVLTAVIPGPPGKAYGMGDNDRRTYASAVDLLDDAQSVGCTDSPIVKLREAALRETEESIKTVKSCMMMQNSLSGSSGIIFYKETVV